VGKLNAVDLLDEALHQLWHAVHDQENFNLAVAGMVLKEITERRDQIKSTANNEFTKAFLSDDVCESFIGKEIREQLKSNDLVMVSVMGSENAN
jgi:hypothetical protein